MKHSLTKTQRTHLLSLAHNMKPVVRIGQHGLTEAVSRETELSLTHHELMKVKVSVGDRDERSEIIRQLTEQTGAVCLRTIGQIAVLYRPAPDGSRIELPSG